MMDGVWSWDGERGTRKTLNHDKISHTCMWIILGFNVCRSPMFPSLPHWVSFPAIGIGYGVLDFLSYWRPSPFPSSSVLDIFHLLFRPLDFNRVSSLRPTYRHPFGQPFTCSIFRRVSRLGTGFDTRCGDPSDGSAVHMEQKTPSKFLPWSW